MGCANNSGPPRDDTTYRFGGSSHDILVEEPSEVFHQSPNINGVLVGILHFEKKRRRNDRSQSSNYIRRSINRQCRDFHTFKRTKVLTLSVLLPSGDTSGVDDDDDENSRRKPLAFVVSPRGTRTANPGMRNAVPMNRN